MPVVRLGKLHLHWCSNCNLPLVENGKCGICEADGEQVKITPPGDVRPAFDADIKLIREAIDTQWGDGYSEKLIHNNKIILLNSSPHLDRMDEVIIDGEVIGNLRYNILKKSRGKYPYEFIIRPWKSMPSPKRGYVVVDDGAVDPIIEGASILSPGIVEVSEDIKDNDEVIILDRNKKVIAAGSAQMNSQEMQKTNYGKAVKNRWRVSNYKPLKAGQNWNQVLEANEHILENKINKAVEFILKKIREQNLPPVVAYSGGKDSLATLHLVLESGIEPDIIFVNTGIELPETIENVERISEKHGLKLITKKANSGYWNNVDYFGPSARDYRWCCKTCKLGPTALLITENYPEGVLSFIGQRRYESKQRMDKGDTWNNPWVPGQKAASPIQDWTALHVWMYLFKKDAEYNELYEKGFKRIGCWLCPASDLAELETIKEELEEYEKFEEVLEEYKDKAGLSDVWMDLGIWRWKEIPDNMKEIFRKLNMKYEDELDYKLNIPPLEKILNDERFKNLIYIRDIELAKSLKKMDKKTLEKFTKESLHEKFSIDYNDVIEFYKKASFCTECGICLARCPNDAMYFENGVKLDWDKCTSCEKCLGKCPVIEFEDRVIQ